MQKAARRVKQERSALSWTLFGLSVLWCYIYVCGVLRLGGVLPPVNDTLTTREITNFMGTAMAPLAMISFTVYSLAMDALLWLLLDKITDKNKVWWICGSFFAFLLGMLFIACTGYVATGGAYSIDYIFFVGCCASMALPGWALGFTYKEICVIVNIYMEAGVCLLSAVWLLKVLWNRWGNNRTVVNGMLVTGGAIYSLLYILAFIGIVAYYPPPLDMAFDKCYQDLIRWAGEYGTTYNNVNYVIFIAGFLVPVVLNCMVVYILQDRRKNSSFASS